MKTPTFLSARTSPPAATNRLGGSVVVVVVEAVVVGASVVVGMPIVVGEVADAEGAAAAGRRPPSRTAVLGMDVSDAGVCDAAADVSVWTSHM
jgi:hypothetical protein